MAHKYLWLAIALVVALVVLADSKPAKVAAPKAGVAKAGVAKAGVAKAGAIQAGATKRKAKKAIAAKPGSAKAVGGKANVKKPAVKIPTAQKLVPQELQAPIAPAPIAPAPIAPAENAGASIFSNPAVTGILAKLQSGTKPTTAEMIPLMLVGVQAGIQSTNPALKSLASTINETGAALEKSKDGKLSTGQMIVYSNKMLTALGNATDTSKENMSKLKSCVGRGMATVNSTDLNSVFELIQNCSQYFGNGTEDGTSGVFKLVTVFLPDGLREVVQSPGVLELMGAIGSMVNQGADNLAGQGAGAVVPTSVVNTLDSVVKGAGLNIDFGQMFSNFNFGR